MRQIKYKKKERRIDDGRVGYFPPQNYYSYVIHKGP
jgi:hypothetical protein